MRNGAGVAESLEESVVPGKRNMGAAGGTGDPRARIRDDHWGVEEGPVGKRSVEIIRAAVDLILRWVGNVESAKERRAEGERIAGGSAVATQSGVGA